LPAIFLNEKDSNDLDLKTGENSKMDWALIKKVKKERELIHFL
jgi:hypothetical protein